MFPPIMKLHGHRRAGFAITIFYLFYNFKKRLIKFNVKLEKNAADNSVWRWTNVVARGLSGGRVVFKWPMMLLKKTLPINFSMGVSFIQLIFLKVNQLLYLFSLCLNFFFDSIEMFELVMFMAYKF